MPVIYRTDDAGRWGTGKGANLTPAEVDGNFWDLAERLVALETGGAAPNGIANIAVTGSQMTVWLDDGTALGPYTLPTAMIRYRGDWASGAAYAEMDLVAVPNAGIYLALRDHTADAAFDASATDTNGNPLYRWLFPMSGRGLDDLSDVSAAAPADGEVLGYDGTAAAWTPRAPGIADAPADGNTYGRLDGAWSVIDTVVNWADIPDKPATFPPDAHTHPSTEVSDFAEGVQDTVGAMVVGGTNVTVTYDDAAGSLTIDASGGGAGALDDLSDVAITTPAAAQVLRFDGASWINAALGWADITGKPATIDAIPGPIGSSGQVLKVQSDGSIAWAADDTGTGSGASVSDEGVQVLAAPTDLNFAGAGVSVTDDGDGTVTITVTGGSASALTDLSDVTITTPAAAQFLRYSGTEWVNAVVDWADLANVPATFPPDAHTHPSGEITDFSEAVDDQVAALLVAGTNVTLTYDDAAGTLTVDASGSGGASALGDLGDVTLTTPAAAEFLRFDGAAWVNAVVGWADVASKPATFLPDAHTHDWSDVTGRPATVDALPSPVGAAGEVMKAQSDGSILWQAEAGGLADAPADGSTYARKDAAWVSIPIEPEEGAYKYWRFRMFSEDQLSGTNSVYLGEIEFRSQAGIAEQATGGTIIGDMGELSQLFDGVKNANGDGASTDPPYTDRYAGYIFPEPKKVNEIAVFAAKNLQAYVPQRFVIEASHDGVAWDEMARADPSGTYYSYTPYLATPEVPPDQVEWVNVLNKPATVAALPGPVGSDGQVLEAQADGSILWASPAGGLADAPSDGTFYGRMDAAWVNLPQGAGSGLDADLLDGMEAAAFAQLNGANAFIGNQTIQLSDDGAGVGPYLFIHRNSNAPAAGDALGEIRFRGRDSAAAVANYAAVRALLDDPTAGAETGRLALIAAQAGSYQHRAYVGGGFYMDGATGGDQGAGTINAQNLYVDGDQLTYERGSWTPTVTGGSYSGTVSDTSGWYSRIGNVVHVGGQINGTDLQFADDAKYMTCGALPFDVLNYEAPGTWSGNAISGLHGAVRPTSTTTFYLMGANKTYVDTRLLFQLIYTTVAA